MQRLQKFFYLTVTAFIAYSNPAAATPLTASPTALLPPQVLEVDASTWAVEVGDINGDGFDDVVTLSLYSDALSAGSTKPGQQLAVNIHLNEGKTRLPEEAVLFSPVLSIPIKPTIKVPRNGQRMGSLQIADIDGDGKPDILVSVPEAGAIVILWNQGDNGTQRFEFIVDNVQPNKSMTLYPELASATNAAPLYAAALDINGDGAKDIVVYHAGLTPPIKKDPTGLPDILLSTGYESFGVMLGIPATPRTFDTSVQQRTWPGCDLQLGGGNCGILPDGMANDHLFDHRLDWKSGVCTGASTDCFFFAPSDVVNKDTKTYDKETGAYTYVPATINSDASTRLRVVPKGLPTRDGQNKVDTFWFEGEGSTNQFVYDTVQKLITRHDKISTSTGHQRSGSSDLGKLSDGHWVLFTGGGMTRCTSTWDYTPGAADCKTDSVPDYLNRSYQLGSFVRWAHVGNGLRGGPILLSLADYYRFWETGAQDYWWPHEKMDGSHANIFAPAALLTWEFLEEETAPGGTLQFKPAMQLDSDSRRFDAIPLSGNSTYAVKPQATSGHIGSTTERSLVVLNYDSFAPSSPTAIGKARVEIYRPDDGRYVPVTPHLEGVIVGKYLKDGFPASISNTLPAGEKSGALVGTQLGAPDPGRYVVVRDKTTRAIKGLFAVGQAETVAGISKDGIVVPGLSTLAIGHYTLELHNAKSVGTMDLNVTNPFGIAASDYDWMAGQMCGLQPDTQSGNLWPRKLQVKVTDFPDADKLQAVRWIKADGTVKEVPAAGYATYDAATSTVTLTIPQDLTDGFWTFYIKSDNQWQKTAFSWNVTHDLATLAKCSQQVALVNEEAYAQCDDTNLYLDSINYKVWPNRVGPGALRFFGSGFAQARIKSAAIKQGTKRVFSSSINAASDNEIHVFFNDDELKSNLVPGTYADLFLYSESGDVVEANGVPASLSKTNWRMPQSGTCPTPPVPEFTDIVNLGKGTGPGGQFQSGDWIEVATKNAWYPIPTSTVFLLKTKDGSVYALNNPRLPDDLYTQHFDNKSGRLLYQIPNDLSAYKLNAGSPVDGPGDARGGGRTDDVPPPVAIELVGAGAGALAVYESYTAGSLVMYGAGGATLGSLAVYGGNWALDQITSKIKALTIHDPGTTAIDKPGHEADDQPQLAEEIFIVGFVSQPKHYTTIGPLDFVVVKGTSAFNALQKARYVVIPAFMLANYLSTGTVDSLPSSGVTPSLDNIAVTTSFGLIGPAGTNPKGIKKKYDHAQVPLVVSCGGLPTFSTYLDADMDELNSEYQFNSVLWRRQVVLKNHPPTLCTPYSETLGKYFPREERTYITDERNDYTKF